MGQSRARWGKAERQSLAGEEPADHDALHPDLGIVVEPGRDFFSIITRQAIRRGTFTSVPDLIDAIRTFIDGYNQRCAPFRWTKTADQVLTKANRQKNSDTRHGASGPGCRAVRCHTLWA